MRKKFIEAYWEKVKEFDDDGDDVVFFTGVTNPDAFTAFSPRGVVLVRNALDQSTWDALIRKVPNEGHQAATTEFGPQLGNYAVAMNSKFTPELRAGGGHRKVDEVALGDDEVLPEKRVDPDVVLRLVLDDDKEPRVVIEIELSNRGPLKLAKHVRQLMKSWKHLRCVVGIKIYKRSTQGAAFPCVCFVWKKRDDDSIYIERIFDIGPRPSAMTSKDEVADFWTTNNVDFTAVAAEDGKSFDVTPLPQDLPYPLPEECLDELDDHFTVTISQDLVYHGQSRTNRSQPLKKQKLLLQLKDDAPLQLELFPVIRAVDAFKAKNFSET